MRCGDIPISTVQKTDRGRWEAASETPLETATLDGDRRASVLDGWECCGAKKAKLSDSEVDIGDYAAFIGLYIPVPDGTDEREIGFQLGALGQAAAMPEALDPCRGQTLSSIRLRGAIPRRVVSFRADNPGSARRQGSAATNWLRAPPLTMGRRSPPFRIMCAALFAANRSELERQYARIKKKTGRNMPSESKIPVVQTFWINDSTSAIKPTDAAQGGLHMIPSRPQYLQSAPALEGTSR